ncbi:MAG: deoxyribose-phosphate aldolase [Bacilli bacterium]|nr:deoxyribose-phosphate aldolase [Bacilli bacterium]MDY5745211.1 deoxyribose-phosphate aldolase [Bacilli bacterium]
MDYNKLIDHTNLKQDALEADIIKLCDEAKEHHFASVCVNPNYVSLCKERLAGSDVKVCTVIGFPLGQTTTTAKIDETKDAIFEGADEIDMVINVSWIKDKRYDKVLYEIQRLKRYCHDRILKVILETCLLSDEEIVKACEIAKEAGADFVKTSTGFSKGGATVHAVELMRKTVGSDMGVKASGGIKTKEDMVKMVEAGASRIGTSSGVELVK